MVVGVKYCSVKVDIVGSLLQKYKIANTFSVINTRDWRRQTQSRFIRD